MEGSCSEIFRAACQHSKDKYLLSAIESGKYGNLPFTKAFVISTREGLPNVYKQGAAMDVLEGLNDFFDRYSLDMKFISARLIKDLLCCASNDLREGYINEALQDVFSIERILSAEHMVKEKLSHINAPKIEDYLRERIKKTHPMFSEYRDVGNLLNRFEFKLRIPSPLEGREPQTRAAPEREGGSS